jgi:hypothetical protein
MALEDPATGVKEFLEPHVGCRAKASCNNETRNGV